jgi:hypothetical protein
MGKAGAHQVPGARTALGHAYGGRSQFFSMWGGLRHLALTPRIQWMRQPIEKSQYVATTMEFCGCAGPLRVLLQGR